MNPTIIPIKAFTDNYIWTMLDVTKKNALVVDPGDAKPVIAFLQKHDIQLQAILVTHHHWDHCNGVQELTEYSKGVKVYGRKSLSLPFITLSVNDNDDVDIQLGQQTIQLKVKEIPGHTLDHIAYYGHDLLFCGDTLFCAGCGRIFEGTPEQMYHSLLFLKSLPDNTRVYCGHEYTVKNLMFAQMVEPNNPQISARLAVAKEKISQGIATVPSLIADEKATNPFFRCDTVAIQAAVKNYAKVSLDNEIEVFSWLRKWKDGF